MNAIPKHTFRTFTLIFLIVLVGLSTLSFQNEGFDQKVFQLDPPDPVMYTVQMAGNESIILRIKYEYHNNLPEYIRLYQNGDSLEFMDDGISPDVISNDNIFTATIGTNVDSFVAQAQQRNSLLIANGHFQYFDGHNGFYEDSFQLFDVSDFYNGLEVEIDQGLIAVTDCGGSIVKHKSLFITDLSVVEDPARTFNFISNTGNPTGLYTFGNMMKSMANTAATGVNTKDFIKSWLRTYTEEVITPNAYFGKVKRRSNVIKFLIAPWITKANDFTKERIDPTITLSNWEARWDALSEEAVLKWAPFRLTAIANRLDLRGSGAYVITLSDLTSNYASHKGQAGETRFVYTLINLLRENSFESNSEIKTGEIPTNKNTDFDNPDFLDWKGMNVILEYVNVQDKTCDLKTFAHGWLNLSELEFGQGFNTALEELTSQVIAPNIAVNMPNGSAIGRIRTNEKIFVPSISNDLTTWAPPSGQFRQFEVNKTSHLLDMVPTSNVPINQKHAVGFNITNGIQVEEPGVFTDWVYKYRWLVARERHQIPLTYQGIPLLDMAATNNQEFTFYVDLDYNTNTPNFSPASEVNQNNRDAKTLRHKVSLNTCQGCHGGENKTLFTMVSPLKFGEEAKYWEPVPSTKFGKMDVRSLVIAPNGDKTIEDDPTILNSQNYLLPTSAERDYINISAFITGRTYDGASFQDDELRDASEQEADNTMLGLYFVNDPSNVELSTNQHNYFGQNNKKNGFNELERRASDMCRFLQNNCENGPFRVWERIAETDYMPLVE